MSEKKVSYMLKKSERITRKIWRIFGASKLSMKFKDQSSEKKSWRYQKSNNEGGEFKEIKDQIIKKVKNSKELHSGIEKCNSRLCMLGLLN